LPKTFDIIFPPQLGLKGINSLVNFANDKVIYGGYGSWISGNLTIKLKVPA
jgi:hypothetical protein